MSEHEGSEVDVDLVDVGHDVKVEGSTGGAQETKQQVAYPKNCNHVTGSSISTVDLPKCATNQAALDSALLRQEKSRVNYPRGKSTNNPSRKGGAPLPSQANQTVEATTQYSQIENLGPAQEMDGSHSSRGKQNMAKFQGIRTTASSCNKDFEPGHLTRIENDSKENPATSSSFQQPDSANSQPHAARQATRQAALDSALLRQEKSRVNYPSRRPNNNKAGKEGSPVDSQAPPTIAATTSPQVLNLGAVQQMDGSSSGRGQQKMAKFQGIRKTASKCNNKNEPGYLPYTEDKVDVDPGYLPYTEDKVDVKQNPSICSYFQHDDVDDNDATTPPTLLRDYNVPSVPAGAFPSGYDEEILAASSSELVSEKSSEDFDENLVVANPIASQHIQIADEMELIEDSFRDEASSNRRRKTMHYLLKFAVVGSFLLLVGIILLISLLTDDSETTLTGSATENTATNTPATSAPTSFLFDLPAYTIDAIAADPTTPQHRAYDWIHQDPWLFNQTTKQLLQLFALATFYFASEGENWREQGGANKYSVCDFLPSHHPGKGGPPPPGAPPGLGGGGVGSPLAPVLAPECGFRPMLPGITFSFPTGPLPFNSTSGLGYDDIHMSRWMSRQTNVCDWFSQAVFFVIPVCDDEESYQSLFLPHNFMRGGFLPPEIGLLTSLWIIFLGDNELEGPIPAQLSLLTNLHVLDLSQNKLTGTLPPQLGLSEQLKVLRLNRNKLEGTLPSQLAQLTSLQSMVLSNNGLTGTMPRLPSTLNVLDLSSNMLQGGIPPSIGKLKDLRNLVLGRNQLSGSIPTELGKLNHIDAVILNDNKLSGKLPTHLALLTHLRELDLSTNYRLSGTLPSEWIPLVANHSLGFLNIRSTGISGTIPGEFCYAIQFDCSADVLCGCGCPCYG